MNIDRAASNNRTVRTSATRILIIDDDNDILSSLKDVFELASDEYFVATATSVESAVQAAEHFAPHIALVDIKMGRSNGLDLIPVLKRRDPNIVCIVMTAYRDVEYAVTAVRYSVDDYLHKPLDPDNLLQLVKRFRRMQILSREKEEAESRFRTIFDAATEWVFLIDPSLHLLEVNKSALDFVRCEKIEVVDKIFWELPWWNLSPGTQEHLRFWLRQAASGKNSDGEIEVLDEDGSWKTLTAHVAAVKGPDNQINTIIAEFNDITELRAMETELNRARDMLEKHIDARTSELMKKTLELERLRTKAEKANKAKSEFLAKMSHEFRTPLNAILGYAQLMLLNKLEPLSDTQRSHVEGILQSSDHLLHLVGDILKLGTLDANKHALAVKDTELNSLIDGCVTLVKPTAAPKNVTIDVLPTANNQELKYWARCDGQALKHILVNLLSNAIKFNVDNGRILITCDGADGYTRISVTDTGIGIPESQHHRVFEPFDQLGKELDTEGSGIGLNVAKRLTELMGGRIGFSSNPGQGSTFWVELPNLSKA